MTVRFSSTNWGLGAHIGLVLTPSVLKYGFRSNFRKPSLSFFFSFSSQLLHQAHHSCLELCLLSSHSVGWISRDPCLCSRKQAWSREVFRNADLERLDLQVTDPVHPVTKEERECLDLGVYLHMKKASPSQLALAEGPGSRFHRTCSFKREYLTASKDLDPRKGVPHPTLVCPLISSTVQK